jgi:hypothetical protein
VSDPFDNRSALGLYHVGIGVEQHLVGQAKEPAVIVLLEALSFQLPINSIPIRDVASASVGYLRTTLNLTICFRQVMLKLGAKSLADFQQRAPSRPTRLLD